MKWIEKSGSFYANSKQKLPDLPPVNKKRE